MIAPTHALTLTQPWATLVAIGQKAIETRGWSSGHRGPLAIHAAKGFPQDARELCAHEPFRSVLLAAGIQSTAQLPTGAVIAIGDMTNCWRFDERTMERVMAGSARGYWPDHEALFGDFGAGRFGFALQPVTPLLEPVPARGMLNLWRLPEPVRDAIAAQAPSPITHVRHACTRPASPDVSRGTSTPSPRR